MKKHKARAQCSGERNPAEYRRRAELATPTSIDQDFNFITNVERSIARADDDATNRGISLAPARQLKRHDARPKWEIEADERRITIIKAPKGLTRAKQNKTHWVSRQKCISWTVEWVLSDNERVIAQCSESRSLGEAFLQVKSMGNSERRRKRPRDNDEHALKARKSSSTTSTPRSETKDEALDDIDLQNDCSETPTVSDQLLTDTNFYLHKPKTPSQFKCLIPISANQLLKDALDGRVLVEFPTIYVKSEPPERLSMPFITEAEYQERYGADIPINVTVSLEDGEIQEPDGVTLPTEVDSQKVLEVLARDMAG